MLPSTCVKRDTGRCSLPGITQLRKACAWGWTQTVYLQMGRSGSWHVSVTETSNLLSTLLCARHVIHTTSQSWQLPPGWIIIRILLLGELRQAEFK